MFSIDKDKLKAHMNKFIADAYVPYSNSYSQGEFERILDTRVNNAIQESFRNGVKLLVNNVVNELIDKMYTADDFEKDIGLR